MSTIENDVVAFTVRLPKALAAQIEQRKVVTRRTRNAEICLLLEQAIDLNVSRDLALLTQDKCLAGG